MSVDKTKPRKKAATYDESSVKVLKGLSAVRTRPGMYMGERGDEMIRRMLKEIVDNSIDEALAGRNTHVETVVNIAKSEYIVADAGGGIPVGKHKEEKVSVLELLFSSLHAGGKFDDSAYKTSSGTHGVGAACTNALSDVFTIYTKREGIWYSQTYEKGEKQTEVAKVKSPPKEIMARLSMDAKNYGTIVYFRPDQSVVSVDAKFPKPLPKNFTPAKLDVRAFVEWTRMIALFNPGLKMVTSFEDKKKVATFHNTKGLEAVVNHIIEKNELSRVAKPFVLQTDNLDIALQWTSYDELDLFNTYVNCGRTRDHGKHFDGFRDALQRALTSHKGKTDKFKTIDAMYGMVGALNYKMSGAEFSSQTKDRLTSNVGKAVEEVVYDALVAFFDKNKTLAKTIIKRAMAITKGRDELKKVMKSVTDVKKSGKGALLPNNLVVSSTKDPMKRELFCFTADTPVALLDGGHKTFAELVSDWEQGIVNVGVAWDCAKGNSAPAVLHHPRVTRYVTELVEVTLDDGSTFRCTADHPWLLENGVFADACDLAPGDMIRNTSNSGSCVVSAVPVCFEKAVPVYDLTVPEYHNFCLSNGAVVHNCVEGDSAGGCFVYETPVLLSDGTTIKFGDMAERTAAGEVFHGISFDIEKQEFVVREFDEPRLTKYTSELIEVELSDGTVFQCTTDHPWLVGTEYVAAENLIEGQELTVHASDKKITVCAIRRVKLNCPIPVYDATMPEHHNFCLGNGVVVHNTAKVARFSDYQEILKLTGKPANSLRAPLAKVLAMKALQHLMVALGIDGKTLDTEQEDMSKMTFSTKNLRVGSVYMLADADVDGGHINCLVLSLIWRVVPDLIREGRVFIVDAPLYNVFHNNKRYFGATFDDVVAQLPKGAPTNMISRAKGWGEISPEALRYVAFDPKTRRVLRVLPPPTGEAEEYFRAIMGENSQVRKDLLGL